MSSESSDVGSIPTASTIHMRGVFWLCDLKHNFAFVAMICFKVKSANIYFKLKLIQSII